MSQFSLHHVTRPSSLKQNAPVLILFHGYGSDENDLFGFASEMPEELFIVSARAPYPMEPYGNAWYAINFDADMNKWNNNEQAIKSRDLIASFIDEVKNAYPINKDNVSILGFSQGTILSYAVALTYPEKVKNIIALSGYISPEMLPDDLETKDYSKLSFYCSHGSADQVIPVEWARKVPQFLNALSIKNTYNEFPVGHGVAPENFYEFRSWLNKRLEH